MQSTDNHQTKHMKVYLLLLYLILFISLFYSCENNTEFNNTEKEKDISIPEIKLDEIINITSDSVYCKVNIQNDGNTEIIEKGIICGTTPNPTTNNNIQIFKNKEEKSTFYAEIGGLKPFSRYYIRAFATNSKGTAYSEEKEFRTLILTDYFVDNRDNRKYKWVKIGEQIWMAENVKYLPTIYNEPIRSLNNPRYYVYKYLGNDTNEARDLENFKTYGVLYNWSAAKKACPNGWHIPSDAEWENLAKTISRNNGGYSKLLTDNKSWEKVGAHLKSNSTLWRYNPTLNINDYEFSALPAGYTDFDNIEYFYALRNAAGFWSTLELENEYIWGRMVVDSNSDFLKKIFSKEEGYSLRCIRDN